MAISMTKKFFLTTAIDYPNSRPHIGTAFEKIGADVQARYRRMEGYDVHFLMGNDENTVKVSRRAAELGRDPKEYCDDMARQFQEVWRALDISFDDFIQTSEPRHHAGCQKFIQKVFDAGYIYKGSYDGLYCDGCEGFKTAKEVKEAGGVCPEHKVPPVERKEPCYFFALSKFQDNLLDFYAKNPDFIQPESRRNEVVTLVQAELRDVNITRTNQIWVIKVPFDPEFTIYVWFDALLNYITAIGYGADDARFQKWWPADTHFIGKDITRFHCALWPAMCFAAGIEPPRSVFGHGFVYIKGEKISKTLGNVTEPMDIITKFSSEAFRYYFMRECPYSGDGEFSWERFGNVYNAELANNLGNLYSRVVTLITKNYVGVLARHRKCADAGRGAAGAEGGSGANSAAHRGLPVQPGTRKNIAFLQRSSQPVRRPQRAVEAGENRQGSRRAGAVCAAGATAARVDLAQTVPAAVDGDDLSQLQLHPAVGAGALSRTPCTPAPPSGRPLCVVAELDKGKVKPLFPVIN